MSKTLVLGALVSGLGLARAPSARRGPDVRAAPVVAGPGPAAPSAPLMGLPVCAATIRDQANPGSCLQASSVPASGLLFPPPHDGGVNNVTSGTNPFLGGGRNNSAAGHYTTVAGGRANTASSESSTVGGGNNNTASGSRATIGGGNFNTASDFGATVGGGGSNGASNYWSTVGGGLSNDAEGYAATIGGGRGNTAYAYFTTVGGGIENTASGYNATVAGGYQNTASGLSATVGGGHRNSAQGDYSFAAGRRAQASHDGAFVWGDGQNTSKTSSAADEFSVYASGGTRIFSDAAATAGVLLAPGGGSWSSVSDRGAKENVVPVEAREVLERVAGLSLSTWNYKAQADSVRHMGPMAQDFHAVFGLGASDKLIDTIDLDGVALAAIQGLHEVVLAKEAEIAGLRARVAHLEGLEARLQRLEEAIATPSGSR